jgi:hypothetical protein
MRIGSTDLMRNGSMMVFMVRGDLAFPWEQLPVSACMEHDNPQGHHQKRKTTSLDDTLSIGQTEGLLCTV